VISKKVFSEKTKTAFNPTKKNLKLPSSIFKIKSSSFSGKTFFSLISKNSAGVFLEEYFNSKTLLSFRSILKEIFFNSSKISFSSIFSFHWLAF
jgi:hypothetical protein